MASVSISCPSCSATDGVVRNNALWRRWGVL
ncbi:IS1 family transposase [Escherichia coli]